MINQEEVNPELGTFTDIDLDMSMSSFFSTLLEKQEPLGKAVLDQNRWGLLAT